MTAIERLLSAIVRGRSHLPASVNRLIDDVAKNPDGLAGRLASTVLGGHRSANRPAPTAVPPTEIRVYIGPTNYAGQGYRWARALEESDPRIGARSMAVTLPGGLSFPTDTAVPVAVYNVSRRWQRSELEAVSRFTHVLFEAERPLLGRLMGRDVGREAAALDAAGVSIAYLGHGTDVRSPRRHLALTEWSYFSDDPAQTAALQRDADANLALLAATDAPIFVSTPDLLSEVPGSHWCPVVVDLEAWSPGPPPLGGRQPVVAHIPSAGATKGTHLVSPVMERLAAQGRLSYDSVSGIPSADMPARIRQADIVLDQFRVGSYGAAACEAMAAGRIVVGHVLAEVRATILERTGLELPIVEATPRTLAEVIESLLDDPEGARSIAARGRVFVEKVHSGAASALALREHWIDRSG